MVRCILQFCHKALAEAHHFSVSLSFRIEVWSTFYLHRLEVQSKRFKGFVSKPRNFKIPLWFYSWVETKSAFIWSNSWVKLNTVTTVHLDFPSRSTQGTWKEITLRLSDACQDVFFDILRMFFQIQAPKSAEEFFNRLRNSASCPLRAFWYRTRFWYSL